MESIVEPRLAVQGTMTALKVGLVMCKIRKLNSVCSVD